MTIRCSTREFNLVVIAMDAVKAVECELDKVLSKLGSVRENYIDVITDLIEHIIVLQSNLNKQDSSVDSKKTSIKILKQIFNKSLHATQKLAIKHKDIHGNISRIGKAIDKNFTANITETCKPDISSDPENIDIINQIICQHFYRQGQMEIADEFLKESGILMDPYKKEQYVQIYTIQESLKNKDIYPALMWTRDNKLQLERKLYPPYSLIKRISSESHLPIRLPYNARFNKFDTSMMKPRPKTKKIKRLELAKKILNEFYKSSSLEFKLHQLAFFKITQKGIGYQMEAVEYARTNFTQFFGKYKDEVQSMMGMLLYIPQGIDNSPYSYMFEDNMWNEVIEMFTRDACVLYGLSYDSLLNVSISAGASALPALYDIKHVMKNRKIEGIWNGKNELPIEIDLNPEHRYHSVFACPILRQQTTNNNPPMKLICGHVVSKDAISKLFLVDQEKIKCPYCPMELNMEQIQNIFF